MFSFRSHAHVVERKARKKTAANVLTAAREKPIRLIHGQVNRVMRIGALPGDRRKSCLGLKLSLPSWLFCLPDKAEALSRLGCPEKAKPDGALPSFARCLIRPGLSGGQIPATRSVWASHPIEWSWSLTALPRFGPPSRWRRVGEVSEQGRMRSGAGREAYRNPVAPRISGKRCYA